MKTLRQVAAFALSTFILGSSACRESVALEPGDFFMALEYAGPLTKPVHEAAYATESCRQKLRDWERNETQFRHAHVISGAEVRNLQAAFNRHHLLFGGAPDPNKFGQGYFVRVQTGKHEYHANLEETHALQTAISTVAGALEPGSLEPITKIRLWSEGK